MIRLLLALLIILTSCKVSKEASPVQRTSIPSIISNYKNNLGVKLDNHIKNYIQKGSIPGGSFYIAYKGEVVYDKALGKRNIDKNIDLSRTDVFRIASMTKAFTTVAVLQLVEEGKINLEDLLSDYIPEFKEMRILGSVDETLDTYTTTPAKNQITIRHLLTHTSGMYYGVGSTGNLLKAYSEARIDRVGINIPNLTTMEIAKLIAKAPLKHEPGVQWTYGLSMDVLGAVIEVVTNKTLSSVFKNEIFKPLGIVNTQFYLPKGKQQMLVPLYTYDEEGRLIPAAEDVTPYPINYPLFQDKGHYAGGGGLSGTAVDYGKFLQALLNKGEYDGKRILKAETIDLMLSEQIQDLNSSGNGSSTIKGIGFCLGHSLTTEANTQTAPFSVGTYNWGGYFNSQWWVDPEQELVFVGMTNILPFSDHGFWSEMYEIIYSSL